MVIVGGWTVGGWVSDKLMQRAKGLWPEQVEFMNKTLFPQDYLRTQKND